MVGLSQLPEEIVEAVGDDLPRAKQLLHDDIVVVRLAATGHDRESTWIHPAIGLWVLLTGTSSYGDSTDLMRSMDRLTENKLLVEDWKCGLEVIALLLALDARCPGRGVK